MKNEKNFYDILRSKFNENEEYPFDEGNWKQMKALIVESRAASKRKIWFAASLGLLLCSAATLGIYELNTQHNTVTPLSPNTAVSQQSATTTKAIASNAPGITKSANTVKDNSTIATNQPVATHPAVVNATQAAMPLQHHKNVIKSFHTASLGSQSVAANNTTSFADKDQNINASTNSNKTELATNNTNTPNSANTTAGQNPTKTSPPVTPKALAAAKGIAKTKAPDTAKTTDLPQRFSDEPRIFMGKNNIISLEVGTEWTTGWAYGPTTQGHGFNFTGGATFAHYLKHNIFLKTGIQFSTYGNMSSFTYNYQHAVNQTNTIFYDSVITTRRLYYLTIPLQAEYYLGHNFSIGAGGSVSYLLGSSGYATTYQQADNNPPTNVKQYSQNIQLSGYNKVNADIRVYGRWLINRHWSMIVMYYNGITDMKNNSFFGENLIERNKGFQFLAAYSF